MSQMSAAQKGAAFLNSSRVFTDRGNSSQSTKPPADPRARRKIPVDGARHPFDVAGEDAPDMAQVLVIATGPQEFRRCTLHISKPKGERKKHSISRFLVRWCSASIVQFGSAERCIHYKRSDGSFQPTRVVALVRYIAKPTISDALFSYGRAA